MTTKKSLVKYGISFVLLILITAGFSFAQRLTGKIMGTVTDEEGVPLPGVTVELSSPSLMGGIYSQVTSEKGIYRFLNLPPGMYKLVFKLEGFQTVERIHARVSLDTTVTEDIRMKITTIEESVTVIAPAPLVDVTKSGLSTIFGKELLEQLPSGRFTFFDIIKQAPGLIMGGQDSDRTVAFGSNYESNSYQLDGVDVSNPDVGSAWHWVNPEVFLEVETLGIGAPAEYGNFTGAVVNVVTKSGGNKFEGSLNYYGQFQALTGDNNPKDKYKDILGLPLEEIYSYNRDKFLDASFNLGGPIVKDRLWFFGSYERVEDSVSPWLSDPTYPAKYIGDKIFFKLTSQLGKKHRLVSSFYYEYFDIPDSPDPYNLPETIGSEIGHVPTWNIMYTWLISNNAFFELKYGGYWSDDDYLPIHSDYKTDPSYYDGTTGITSDGMWWPWIYTVSRHQANANLSYFAEDFLGGDHDFKIGVQYNRGTAESHGGYAGGHAYYYFQYYYYGYYYPYLYKYEQDVFVYGGLTNSIGAFVDDSWKIGDRLTVNLGLRFDHSTASMPPFPVYDGWEKTGAKTPEYKDLIKWNTISPRIGLAFQLTSDQKTLLKASFGRYYDALHMSNWNWPGPNVTDWYLYNWNWNTQEWDLWDFVPGGMGYTLDPKLKNPYADQFSIGLEREIFPNFSISATYIYKKEKNLVGWEDKGATYEQVQMVSPDDGKSYLVWNQTSGPETNDYWITHPSRFGETFDQTYQAVIFNLTKRYSNNWQLNASLTWSRAEGLNNTAHTMGQQAMIWYTVYYGRDPNDLINARGIRNQDRTWIFKLSASYSFPWGFLASVNYLYQTGRPIPNYVRVYPDQGMREILSESRGKERFDTWSMLDFRLQKTFGIYKSVKLHAILDVFNVLNTVTVLNYPYSFYGNSGYSLWSGSFHTPDSIFHPRRAQVGVRLEF